MLAVVLEHSQGILECSSRSATASQSHLAFRNQWSIPIVSIAHLFASPELCTAVVRFWQAMLAYMCEQFGDG